MDSAAKEGPQPGSEQARTNRPSQPASGTLRSSRDSSPTLRRDMSSTHGRTVRKQPSASLIPSLPPSLGTSPQTSRNTSPIRQTSSQQQASPQQSSSRNTGSASSRRDSHDASPIRPASSHISSPSQAPPSAAAIQRALSAANVPHLYPGSGSAADTASKLARPSRPGPPSEAQNPISPSFSPRLKSPGPSAPSSRRNSMHRKADVGNAPPITVQNSTPPSAPSHLDVAKSESNSSDSHPLQTPKSSTRGPSGPKSSLETVQEATPPADSLLSDSTDQSFHSINSSQSAKSSDGDRTPTASVRNNDATDKNIRSGESDGDGNRSDGRGKKDAQLSEQTRNRLVLSKTAPSSTRSKQVEGTRNMTVETETVASIPQSNLNPDRSAGVRSEGVGSVRLKPSNETIRPRKERRKAARKAPSIHNGTASSKADIFEARVASQVDEANSSDSDETFVYESNPPEPQMRTNRNHSRTPSVTSIHSQSERRGGYRGFENHRVAGKRSMKFSNNPYSVLDSPTDGDPGTIRAHHPRNISRFGRTIGSNSSIYDQDSPFTQASKIRQTLAGSNRQTSRPTTPQNPNTASANPQPRAFAPPWARKQDGFHYDFDGEGADDERAPLIGTVRTPRNRHIRRGHGRPYESMYNVRQTSWFTRFGGCVLGTVVVVMIIIGAASFLFMSNKALFDVEIYEIQNVLASEQEIMLDMVIGAINPNVLGISVTEMDVNVFAKSKHLGTSTSAAPVATGTAVTAQRRRLLKRDQVKGPGAPWQDPDGHWGDDGHDAPIEGDSQTMLLGRVFKFDQGLYFEGSPVKRHAHFSVGEFRLGQPGNRTESGGSARWERVLQYPFELILRGVLKYQLPISSKDQSAAISGSVIVHPEEGLDEKGRMRLEHPKVQERWQWIEPDEATDGA